VAQPASSSPTADNTVPAKMPPTSCAPVSWIVWLRAGIEAKCPATMSFRRCRYFG
jgi:hypothetical protein